MILTIAGVIVKVIGAISKILVSRILGGEGIGLYQMAYPIYQLAVSIATAGLPVAISIMIADTLAHKNIRDTSRIFKLSFLVLTGMGIIFSLLLYLVANSIVGTSLMVDSRAYYAIIALVPAILVVTILSCFRGYFQGFQDMMPTGVSQIFEQIFRVIFMVGLAVMLLPHGLEYAAAGATFATLPGVLAGLLVLVYFYYRQRKLRDRLWSEQLANEKLVNEDCVACQAPRLSNQAIIKRLLVLAIPVSVANIMIPLVSSIDLFIVPQRLLEAGYHVDEATTLFGYLTGMATSLVNLPTILTASLAASLVPAVSEAFSLGDRSAIKDRTQSAMKLANLITIPSFVGMCILATPISNMLYATPHAGGSIAIMSLSIILLGIQQVTTGILQGEGDTTIPMMNLLIGIGLKCILSWNLTALPEWGISGAAWSTNIGFGLAAILNLYYVYRHVGYTIPLYETTKISLSAMAMGGAAAMLYYMLSPLIGNAGSVLLAILVAILVYVGALLITKAITDEDLQMLPGLRKFAKR